MSDLIVKEHPNDYVGLAIARTHDFLLMTTPPNPKGQIKSKKRLSRIKRNLLREMKAYNKEMRRYPKEVTLGSKRI